MAEKGPPQHEEETPLSPKAKVHYGRLYQIHDWMSEEEKTRVRSRIHLFRTVNKLRPGYFNHQVELMDDTTTKYLPCRDYQVGSCRQGSTHYHTRTKSNGKKSAVLVIHGCDLCYYGRWDLGFHTINNCHLKHLVPKGTGETPWDRRDRKKKEERGKTIQAPKQQATKRKVKDTIDIASSSSSSDSSSSSTSSSEEEDEGSTSARRRSAASNDNRKRQKRPKVKKKTKKKKKDKLSFVTEQLKQLSQQVAEQNKIMLQHNLKPVPDTQCTGTGGQGDPLPSGLSETADTSLPGNHSLGGLDDDPVLHEPLSENPFDVTPMGGNNQEKSLEQLSMDYTECETLLDSVENNQQ